MKVKDNKMLLMLVFLVCLFFGCIDENSKESRNAKPQILFDAVDVLGKNSSEVDKVFGKPSYISRNSYVPGGYRYYVYKKELGIFFNDENKNTEASGVLYIFDQTIPNAIEAAYLVGIDLSNIKPYDQEKSKDYLLSKYKTIEKGKKIGIYFEQVVYFDKKQEDVIKIFLDE